MLLLRSPSLQRKRRSNFGIDLHTQYLANPINRKWTLEAVAAAAILWRGPPPSAPHATRNALPDAGKVGPVPGRIILTAEERAQMDIQEETK